MLIGRKIIHLEETDSTNNYLKNNFENGLLVFANAQTSGRGQRENKWISETGKNILMSFGLVPENLNVDMQFFLSKAVSLAVFDFLSKYIESIKIKWPNDIYVKDKKIAGILIENSLKGSRISNIVAGIGININQDKFPATIPNPISLKQITGLFYELENLQKELIKHLNIRLQQLVSAQYTKLTEDYLRHLYRYKTESLFLINGEKTKARIIDIAKNGSLILAFNDKEIKNFAFKELEFVI